MEHWEILRDLVFVWEDELFRPGLDSFLLASFPPLRPGLRVCDLGCGTGLVSLLLLQRERELQVTGLDIQPEAVALAEKAVARNGLGDRLSFRLEDLRAHSLPAGSFDLVVSNPPYYPIGSGALAREDSRRRARAEVDCTLEDVCRGAAGLLRWGGRFCLIYKPERLTDLLCALRAAGLEPKRLRLVCGRPEQAPSLVLLEARRGGRPGLEIRHPFVLRTPEDRPTPELDQAYFRQEASS